jgi:hypothetical protein
LRPGSWNYVDLPSMPVTAGQRYWIAVLGTSGGGTVSFRDRRIGGLAETSAQHKLTALPASTGKTCYQPGLWPLLARLGTPRPNRTDNRGD